MLFEEQKEGQGAKIPEMKTKAQADAEEGQKVKARSAT